MSRELEYIILGNEYVTSGSAEFSSTLIRDMPAPIEGRISWDELKPEGTDVNIYTRLSSGEYELCENGGIIPGIVPGKDYSNETLFIKVVLSTEDANSAPCVSKLLVQILNESDDHILILSFDPGITNSIQNAVSKISVTYDGTGTLKGRGGLVSEFNNTFIPVDLEAKNNPNGEERFITNVTLSGNLIQVYYTNAQGPEHFMISVSVSGVLTNVDDI